MTLKWRIDPVRTEVGINRANSVPLSNDGQEYRWTTGAQTVNSWGNAFRLLGRTRRDIGANFTSRKVELNLGRMEPTISRQYNTDGSERYWVKTHVVPSVEVANMARNFASVESMTDELARSYLLSRLPTHMSENEIHSLGGKAISMLNPLNPVADTATTIAEFLSERKFFSLPGTSGSLPGEYLNYMFGIAPTVGFAKDLREAIRDKEKHLDQLHRDSGRWVRRAATVLEDKDVTTTTLSRPIPGMIGPALNSSLANSGVLRTMRTVETRAWFSGAFTYHLPREGTTGRTVAELDKLYGVKPSFDTAWELLPFSWLIDYKINIGDALQNMNAFANDGLVMPYAYIMVHQSVKTEWTWSGRIRDAGGTFVPTTLSATTLEESKVRRSASPFGFGISPGALTGRQWSILAALGLTYLEKGK